MKRCRLFGEKKKEKDLVRKELARVRATAMEGLFGTQKEHYDLRKIKARTKRTEILYIFFGIHTANVVQLADRIEQGARLVAAWHGDLQSMRISCVGGKNCILAMKNGQKIRTKRPETDVKLKF